MRFFLTLATSVAVALTVLADQPEALFEPPVRLMSDGLPINQREKLLYPSPVLLDLNADKQNADKQKVLVVGDLWGKLRVYQPTGKRGDLNWGKATNLQAKGKDLVVPNW
jgi:hypothetical protein